MVSGCFFVLLRLSTFLQAMKNTPPTRLAALLLLALLLSLPGAARANDDIFPPAPAAASSINFDGRGFLVHGKRTFIASGGMEYARIPHALWRDRLLRLKRAGFNCVEIYTFWNVHEPRPNEFNFSGDADLNAFLKTVKSLGLYAIVRVGPYVCAEWDSGGYPVWLRFVPGLRVREDNAPFLAAVDRYWDKLMPIVAANQINRGGPVILVQLENEHPQGWGTEMPNAYFVHLRDKAVALGLQVPYFFSGLHHASDPAGNNPWSSKGRQSPWISTEFWSVWYNRYGQTEADTNTYDRRMWKVLAYGGNGLNFYMFHGGSNFGYTNDDEDAASYDYGAAIGQTGDLRPTYYRFKRAALFARSFESILEDSDDATNTYKAAATNPAVRVTARKSASGTILFLDNPGQSAVKTQVKEADGSLFPASGLLTVAPGQIAPIVRDFPLALGVVLERATPLLGIVKQGKITTLVAYSAVGDATELRFNLSSPVTNLHTGGIKPVNGQLTLRDTVDNDYTSTQSSFQVNGQTIQLISLSTRYTDDAWFVNDRVIIGPEYVGDITGTKGMTTFVSEDRTGQPQSAIVFGPGLSSKTYMPGSSGYAMYAAGPFPEALYDPPLTNWQSHTGSAEAAPSYAGAKWKASADPLAMGADGDASAYAWYRSTLTVPKTGTYTLRFTDGGDWASVFVNGKHVAEGTVKAGVPLTLTAGTYPLALLTAHYGRPKLFNYLGLIDTVDTKGLRGPVILDAGSVTGTALTTWRVQADAGATIAVPPTDTTGAGWADGTTGPDIFNGRSGYAWYVATLPATAGPQNRLRFENVDDTAVIFLNGKQVATHDGFGQPFTVPLDGLRGGSSNVLAVRVQNTGGGGGIQSAVTLQTVKPGDETPVIGWKMHGGIGEPGTLTGWQTGTTPPADGAPAYYRATFTAAPPAATGPHPILRVTTTGLSHGFIWLNGHNLGRYPEKIAVNGLYLPEPWLKAGQNEVVIFDEQGKSPAGVTLTVEQAASRFVVPMTATSLAITP